MNNKIETTLEWIKDVRTETRKIIERDARKLTEMLKKGNWDNSNYRALFEEIRDNERDDALLSLVQGMLEEDKLVKSGERLSLKDKKS